MICFMCEKPILPEKGYFRTQLWNGKKLCHVNCRPKFYFDNKPEEDSFQTKLFEQEKPNETSQKAQ